MVRRRPFRQRVWLIVSQLGPDGALIAIAIAGIAAGERAPAELRPRATLLGRRLLGGPSRFRLVTVSPSSLHLAGRFLPADGQARLFGPTSSLRLAMRGRGPGGRQWRIAGGRAAWIGEVAASLSPAIEREPPRGHAPLTQR